MSTLNTLVNWYLTPPASAFWNWSEDGEAIVWIDDNQTIAFRSELETILRRHTSKGLPPLGSILLLIAACRDSWGQVQFRLKGNFTALMSEEFRQLDKIHAIPPALRAGIAAKTELSAMIFETSADRTSPDVAGAVIDALSNGLALEFIRWTDPFTATARQILDDLKPLGEGLRRFELESFKLRLETGLEELVAPADVEEPLAQRIRKLFDQLQSDEEFAGMVRLARNLLAMVNLPRLLTQSDEIPVGGVSDISNRGTLDRMLLSELAQDDEMLITRVAMNEAMYLRRETPPRNPPRARLLLLDTGLRMWGIPRVLATSAAMSFAAMNSGPVDLRVLRSEGDRFVSTDLSTRKGLIEHLKALDPHVHPGKALADLARWMENEEHETDVILVTSDSVLADHEFQEALEKFGEPIEFLVTLSSGGTFQLLQRTLHGTRLLREAHLDLDQLFAPAKKPVLPLVDPKLSRDLPAILALDPFPLRLSHNLIPRQAWTVRHHGVLAITNDKRLMHWDNPNFGARQITDRLSSRRLLWSQTHTQEGLTHFVIGNASKPKLQLGIVDVEQGHCEMVPLEASKSHVYTVCAHVGALFVVHRDLVEVWDMASGERIQIITTPRGYRWSHGRYFRSWRGWKALSYDGMQPRFEDVPMRAANPIALFDVEGIQGPVGVVSMSGKHSALLFLSVKDFLPLHGALVPPIRIVRISPNGKRIIVKHRGRGRSDSMETAVIDIDDLTVMPISGDPDAAVDPEIRRLAHPSDYRNRFLTIGGHADGGLMLRTPDLNCWDLSYDDDRHRFRIASAGINPNRVTSFRRFLPIPPPQGVGYKLQMAEWSDGSRAFLDSRGLLHLKSSDPKVPEATFVLSGPNLAGWCANGDLWGEEYYTGKKSGSMPKENLKNILSAFVSRLR